MTILLLRRRFVRLFARAVVALFLLVISGGASLAAQTPPEGLRIIKSNPNLIILELITPPVSSTPRQVGSDTYLDLNISGWGNLDLGGQPALPVFGTMIAVPQDANPSLTIRADVTRTELVSAPPAPAPTMRVAYPSAENLSQTEGVAPAAADLLPQLAGLDYVPDVAIYSGNAPYPENIVNMDEPSQWRSQRYVRVQFRPVQYNPATRELVIHQRIRLAINFNRSATESAAAAGGPVDEGAFEPILENAFFNYESARAWRTEQGRGIGEPGLAEAAGATVWYKIPVSVDKIYRIDCAQLTTAGIDTTTTDVTTLRVFENGTEIALRVHDNNGNKRCNGPDYFEFYGQAAKSKYTDTNIYWLTFGGAAGKRMAVRTGPASGPNRTVFTASLHLEENHQFIGYLPLIEDADHWYWDQVPNVSVSPAVKYRDYAFTLDNLSPTPGTAALRVALAGFSETNHDTRIYVNGTRIHQVAWSGRNVRTLEVNFASNLLQNGANTFRIEEGFGSPNLIYVNSFDLDYPASFNTTINSFRAREIGTGARTYPVTGYATNDLETFDLTDALNPELLQTTVVTAGAKFTAQFSDDRPGPREYLTLTVAKRGKPASITPDTGSSLRTAANGADYIFITHSSFKANIQPLVNLRTAQGMRVKVVDVQDVYDEFSDGSMTPQAIRDFLAYAYANWQTPRPAYVLLVGNGNFNFKNYTPYPTETNFIPPLMRVVDPWVGEVATDNQFVTLDSGSRLPSMAIGRLPALKPADVNAMVNKIVTYETAPPGGAWRNQVTFVTDNAFEANGAADPAGNFFALSDAIASNPYYVPAPVSVQRVYYNPCPSCTLPYSTYPTNGAARNAVLAAINSGKLIVNYVGHGAIQQWSESLLKGSDAAAFTNGNRTPVMLPMTCYEAYFQFPGTASVSEAMVLSVGNGAVASWGPTGLGVATGHDFLDRGFFEAVFKRNIRRVGAAAIEGKRNLWVNSTGNRDLLDTFNLLGDPATQFPGFQAAPTATPTPKPKTATPTRTATPKPKTATPTHTATPKPKTNTPTRTATPLPKTNTPTRTNTPLPKTNTPTRTNTPLPKTNTPTRTNTPLPKTNTPTRTNTPPPKTNTPTRTRTPIAKKPEALSKFLVKAVQGNRVRVKWRTDNEEQIVAFQLWRQKGNGKLKLLSPEPITAKRSLSARGAKYSYADKAVKPGRKFSYRLEIIYIDGASEWSETLQLKVE